MPRGNDGERARRDLDSQYGEHANAEDLIRAHDEKFDPVMHAALQKPVDQEATDALDLEKIDGRNGGTVVSAAVRGGTLVAVEDVHGELVKWCDDEWKGLPSKRRNPAASDSTAGKDAADTSEAPAGVHVPEIKAKLEELGIDEGSATKKDDLWALLPGDAQTELAAAAA